MNRVILISIFVCFFICQGESQRDSIILKGIYQGKNIFLEKTTLCLKEVFVNKLKYDYNVCYSGHPLYEIDFSCIPIRIGDTVNIKIIKEHSCNLVVTNADVLLPKPTFSIVTIQIDSFYVLHWVTKDEMGSLPFTIELYRWKKWVKIGEVKGIGSPGLNKYDFSIKPNSGENKVRILQTGFCGIAKKTDSLVFMSKVHVVSVKSRKITKEIVFSSETMYQLFDPLGALLKEGYGKKIICSDLKKGTYYLNYDNSTIEITKL